MNVFDILRKKIIAQKENDERYQLYASTQEPFDDVIKIVNQVEKQYAESFPKPIPSESADYAHEAAYIKGWNECLEKILKME